MARPDRRAQRNPQGPQHQADQEQDQEIEVGTETQEPEHQRAQSQLGNQALADMLASRAQKSDDVDQDAGGGLAQGLRPGEKEGIQYGGDDDPLEDTPISLEELTASWNPTVKKGEDRPAFLEAMPDDDLPPEDDDWYASVRALSAPELPDRQTPDGLLQPSPTALSGSLGPWAREVARWLEPDLVHRCLAHTLVHPPACLQDPWGRVLFSRARIAALASWSLLGTRTLAGEVPLGTAAFLDFTLEVASGARRVRETARQVLDLGQKLPRAADLYITIVGESTRRVAPHPLPAEATARLVAVLRDLTALENARTLIPSLTTIAPTEADPDDPLDLDAVLAAHTGGPEDPEAAVYHAAVQGAERLAAACARTRVAFVGAALAVGDACADWSAGTPTATLHMLAGHVDTRVQGALQLLVEIARAAQRRSVPPRGLTNGLRRAAKQIEQIRREAFGALSQVAGAVVPGEARVPGLPADRPADPLEAAWRDGEPREALPWVAGVRDDAARATAEALVRAGAGDPPATLAPLLLHAAGALEASGRPFAALALETVAGPCLLWDEDVAGARAIADRHEVLGRERGNASVVAAAALLGMEADLLAGEPERAAARRLEAGRFCWHSGAFGPLSLLARWAPPDDD